MAGARPVAEASENARLATALASPLPPTLAHLSPPAWYIPPMSITALYKALLEANVSEETAERAVEGLISANEAATKTDVAGLKADMAELKADMAELKVDMLRWNIVIAGVIIAAVGLIVKL